mgnify:CR=1 FL=1
MNRIFKTLALAAAITAMGGVRLWQFPPLRQKVRRCTKL